VLLVLMLSGPVLHHRKTIGELSRLLLFVDGSRSMELSDSTMALGRKVAILQRMGMLAPGAVKMELPRAGEALAEAQAIAGKKSQPGTPDEDAKARVESFAAKVAEARGLVAASGAAGDLLRRLDEELITPVGALGGRELKSSDDRKARRRGSGPARRHRWQDSGGDRLGV
jgi:hypothetical protein